MDELLYALALGVGIVGGMVIWKYSRTKRRALAQKIHENKKNKV